MLDKIIESFKVFEVEGITNEHIDDLESLILNHKEKNGLSRDEKDEIVHSISRFVISTNSSELLLKKIDELIHGNQIDHEIKELLIHCLIESSETEISSRILKRILSENNFKLKEVIYYYHVLSPLRHIYETEEFKDSIIAYINSQEFKRTFKIRCEKYPAFGGLFAFPSLYSGCFDLTRYSSNKYKNYSKSYLSKLNLQSRINSIRVIEDDIIKLELINRYFHYYLGNLYNKRFIKVLDREFPNLQLAKKYL